MQKAVLYCAPEDRKHLSALVAEMTALPGHGDVLDLRVEAIERGPDALSKDLDAVVVVRTRPQAAELRGRLGRLFRAARRICPSATRSLVSRQPLRDMHPRAAKELLVLLHEGDVTRLRHAPDLERAVGDALTWGEERERRDEPRGLSKRTRQLETLGEVGVTLASSFDIRAILAETQRAAVELLGTDGVEVFYAGHEAIHSRPRWHPSVPEANGGTSRRAAIERRFARRSSPEPTGGPSLLGTGDAGTAIPVAHQGSLLGAIVLPSGVTLTKESAGLLALLALQAATALGNIHLTQQRIHSERLSIIGKMIGSVVHDFRGPLTAARGYAGMLSKPGLEDEERSAYGRYLLEECDRMNDMVQELLDFSGGRSELAPSWIVLGAYLSRLAERLTRRFGPTLGANVELGFDGELFVDERRLERALWNLGVNAAQAMPSGGRLVLRSNRRDDSVLLEVEDEGAGIPESIRHRIFEPFLSFGKAEGVGLGMATAKRIVEEHGGRVDVETETGRGTLVRISLPAVIDGVATARPRAGGGVLAAPNENAR